MNYLSDNIPNDLVNLLGNAESFDVWFFNSDIRTSRFEFESKYLDFQANQVNENIDNRLRKKLISALIEDFEKGGVPSRYWVPHHGIRAVYKNQLLEIGVCFTCGWFRGQLLENEFYGTIPDEKECKSKVVFDEIIEGSDVYGEL